MFAGLLKGAAPLNYDSVSWIGLDGCAFATAGQASSLNILDGANSVVSSFVQGSAEVTLTYDPSEPAEDVTMSCPGANPIGWHTTAWKIYFDEMHAAERVGSFYQSKTALLAGETIATWTYHNTTSSPSGQAVVEDTTIEIVHRPQG